MGIGLVLIGMLALVVVIVRKAGEQPADVAPADAHTVRRVFQYLLIYGLLVVVAVGLAGLLGRALERDLLVTGDEAELARDLAFTVVGGPLLLGLVLWSRRRLAESAEIRSLAWALYISVASLTSLVVAATALGQVFRWVTGLQDYHAASVARLLVWGGVWGIHWWIDRRVTPQEHSRLHHLAGSLIGLAVAVTGFGSLLAAAFRILTGLDRGTIIISGDDPLLRGLVTLAVGAPVWLVYWARTAVKQERDPLWFAYVLLAGVGGGLITAIVSCSLLVYSVLVWLIGEPMSADAAEQFTNAPTAAGAAVAGMLVWWYHQAVLQGVGGAARSEVRRVYEHLMAGIGLVASGAGLIMVLAALIETVAGNAFVGGAGVNTLLAAVTLFAVGGPVWWLYWRWIQSAARQDPAELLSPTRRVYLMVLFGSGGTAAIIALIAGFYLLFQDAVEGTLGVETLRSMRFSIGVLLTTATVAAYHWVVYRTDREQAAATAEPHGPRFVLLIGPPDAKIARELASRTQAKVQFWARTDDGQSTWSVDDVLTTLAGTDGGEVVVLADGGGLRAIPIRRG